MPIATFRGERTISEIADKLYTRLTPRQRERAEAAILKANPQLGNLRTLRKGAILRVPDLPELRAKTNRNLENPQAHIAKNLAQSLERFSKHIAERFDTELKHTRVQSKLLKSAKFRKDISKVPSMQTLAGEATKALDTRSKKLAEQHKKVKNAINQALDNLQ